MATLTCSNCGANTEANSIEEGRKRLDHSRGLLFNKPCEDGKAELFLTGDIEKPKTVTSKIIGNTKNTKKNQSKD